MHYGDNRQMLSSLEGLNAYAEPGEALGVKWSSDLICPKSTKILTNQHHPVSNKT